MQTCICCGRVLTDPVSIAAGIGPVCAMTAKEAELASRNGHLFRAEYRVRVDAGVIVIEDLDRGRTVTNDAEAVIADLARVGHDLTLPVMYRDSSGIWDGMEVAGGRFAGFFLLQRRDYGEARRALRERLIWRNEAPPPAGGQEDVADG